jgi:hypothetical protein
MPEFKLRTAEVTLKVQAAFVGSDAELVGMVEDILYKTVRDEAKLSRPEILSITVVTN